MVLPPDATAGAVVGAATADGLAAAPADGLGAAGAELAAGLAGAADGAAGADGADVAGAAAGGAGGELHAASRPPANIRPPILSIRLRLTPATVTRSESRRGTGGC